jgi:putative ABC transport system permease protein
MSQGATVVAVGIALGLAGALALSRLMSAVLFGVDPLDPATYATVAGALGIIAMLAIWVPARRAAKVDPILALRAQ